ncbi:HAD family hydrolase [Pseudonocardia sp. TRM90224]|uniref:HAD family hydrolase n=1 Tax=Pseudonocardia sp. TRM90224 TaxID=2812678 RepID=UPI001E2E8514|nr:HAD family hydrolase [Pseudonocardia sp. TRM90224]
MIDAALFDFSGTLFRLDYSDDVLLALLGEHAAGVSAEQRADLLRRVTTPHGLHSGLTEEEERDWHNRDLDPAAHERANIAVLRLAGLAEEIATSFYGGMKDAANWTPYPDTEATLQLLRERGVRVAVISNIAWDVRPCFERAGVADLVDEYVFSFEHGVQKPDERIFKIACERLGVGPERSLMIGDSEVADGAARDVGCDFALVPPLPTAERPDALITIIRAALG